MYKETSKEEITTAFEKATEAFQYLKNQSIADRATLMYAIADKIASLGSNLIDTAMAETALPEARLVGERARTVFQWRSYADALVAGNCLELSIDTAVPDKTPPKPDLRKMKVGLGPVVVFGASNFPFAFSTAGGDTASALAAGCPVIVKAHPAHPKTSTLMAEAIKSAIEKAKAHPGVFHHVYGDSKESGAFLVHHPATKAVAFTGSFQGGKALFDLAAKRKEPIPVFAEMGSINPLFVLPNKLQADPEALAVQYVASLTLGVGQFCTNPGVLAGISSAAFEQLKEHIVRGVQAVAPARMLHGGIAASYVSKQEQLLANEEVEVLAAAREEAAEGQGRALVAEVAADRLLLNGALFEEVFGPFGLIVSCRDEAEMLAVAKKLDGQLTITLVADEDDIRQHQDLVEELKDKCGRLLFNGMPTGVEVCTAMQHGGPFPATTDSRFTSVGPDAIRRFLRPLAFQNWPDSLLPDALKNSNPLGVFRMVNNVWTKEPIAAS
ncbi:aldehyde dehydrogenase (NADP(+)) [Olivibacter sp. SDN3]|uniref:aldehyde dehydrogenase (NADP(+)) n=1 Tax=Olivibacter sp. SDN3 TaxID=2764720 RepID=UPI0016517B1D|nr:aldehyde dehydrogenase (NADP(+)) [Olivibacter sp. SDN3]QNL50746.1 aldehyde dehydrogenase (NADP(+)) [Olivibacter sp. SDN3]